MNKLFLSALLPLSFVSVSHAEEVQDMSDPLAVYSQAGIGMTDKGLNLKLGQSYSTGIDNVMAMNIIEIKGIAGELSGWSGNSQRDNSIDSVRIRNFQANLAQGTGTQIDLNYSIETEALDASYSYIKAMPEFAGISFYPLIGAGFRAQNSSAIEPESSAGYTIPGTFAVVGTYSSINLTDKIWFNYNPMWLTTLSGSEHYKDNAYGKGNGSILLHELSLSYQYSPRLNIRYFMNSSEYERGFNGDQRIEVNYQL